MVESFKVREEDAVRVDGGALRTATTGLFEKVGVPRADAALAADVLVMADLRGVDSHGVSNMLKSYLDRYQDGSQNPRPDWHVVRERAATANIDGDRGLGTVIAPRAMEIAIAKARETGVGMTATGPQVLPTYGREARLGTNPMAMAAPAGREPAFVFDMATSVVPINKIRNAHRLGVPLPAGHIADGQGTPIMQQVDVPAEYLVLPLGSTRELGSHKGYGLASVVEILCSVMAGVGFGMRLPRGHFRHFVAAYDIDAFSDVAEFKQTMDDFLGELKATPPASGHDRVMVAGQPEWEMLEERTARGIPLHHDVVDWFRDTCSELGVPCNI